MADFEITHKVEFAQSSFANPVRVVIPQGVAFEIPQRPVLPAAGNSFVFRRALGTPTAAIEILKRAIGSSLPSLVFRRVTLAPQNGLLIDVIAVRRTPGDTSVELVYRIPAPPPVPVPDKRVNEGDILLSLNDSTMNITVRGTDLVRDPGLESAIVLSLFTDKRVTLDDPLPNNSSDLRGWWGDRNIGSKLWLLSRSKLEAQVVTRAREYALDALKWLVLDGVASRVNVETEKVETDTIIIRVQVFSPDLAEGLSIHKYFYNWKNQTAEST